MISPRSENGRNSAERAPTTTGAWPLATARQVFAPRRLADLGMPLRRLRSEAAAEAIEPLRAERDFGEQHQYLPPGSERRRDRREIGLGLAGPGNPVEHRDAEPGGAGPFEKIAGGAPLIRRQDRGIVPPVGGGRRRRRGRNPALLDQAGRDQTAHHPRACFGAPRDFGGGHGAVVAQLFEDAAPRRGQLRALSPNRRARPARPA